MLEMSQKERLTPIAVTKFAGRFLNLNALDTPTETRYETKVCTMKITGMIASSTNLSAVNCDANFVKTTPSQRNPNIQKKSTYSSMA